MHARDDTGRLEHVQREELSSLAAGIGHCAQLAVSGSDFREAGRAIESGVILEVEYGSDVLVLLCACYECRGDRVQW